MNRRVEVLAILLWVRAGLAVLGALLFLAVGVLGGMGLISPEDPVTERVQGMVGAVLFVGFFALLAVGYAVTGLGLRRLRPWARTVGIALGILDIINCCGFPVNTAIGIFTLVVLLNDEVARLFESRPLRPAGAPPVDLT